MQCSEARVELGNSVNTKKAKNVLESVKTFPVGGGRCLGRSVER